MDNFHKFYNIRILYKFNVLEIILFNISLNFKTKITYSRDIFLGVCFWEDGSLKII